MRTLVFVPLLTVGHQLHNFSIEAFHIGPLRSSPICMSNKRSDGDLTETKFVQRRNRLVSFFTETIRERNHKSSIHRSPIRRLADSARIRVHTKNNSDKKLLRVANYLINLRGFPFRIHNQRSNERKSSQIDIQNNPREDEHRVSRTILDFFDWIINLILNSQTFEPAEDLSVTIRPARTMIPRLVLQGQFHGDITVQFKKIYFPALRITGGGVLQIQSIRINFYSWIPAPVTSTVQHVLRLRESTFNHRFPSPFKLQAYEVSLTNEDLLQSSCMRIGLRNILRRIMKSLSYLDVMVQSVNILPSEKVSCQGIVILPIGTSIPFEIRSGIRATCDGHVLEFPGLEILFSHFVLPVTPDVAVYMGENFQFTDFTINGSSRLVQFSAKAKIIPHSQTSQVPPIPSPLKIFEKDLGREQRESYPALVYYDAADWIKTICRLI